MLFPLQCDGMQPTAVALAATLLLQDAKAEKFKDISKLVQEPRMDTLGVPTTSAL